MSSSPGATGQTRRFRAISRPAFALMVAQPRSSGSSTHAPAVARCFLALSRVRLRALPYIKNSPSPRPFDCLPRQALRINCPLGRPGSNQRCVTAPLAGWQECGWAPACAGATGMGGWGRRKQNPGPERRPLDAPGWTQRALRGEPVYSTGSERNTFHSSPGCSSGFWPSSGDFRRGFAVGSICVRCPWAGNSGFLGTGGLLNDPYFRY